MNVLPSPSPWAASLPTRQALDLTAGKVLLSSSGLPALFSPQIGLLLLLEREPPSFWRTLPCDWREKPRSQGLLCHTFVVAFEQIFQRVGHFQGHASQRAVGGMAAHTCSVPFGRVWVCLSPLGLSSSSSLEGHVHALLMLLQAGRLTQTPLASLTLGDIEKNVTFMSHSATKKINKTKLWVGCSPAVRCLSRGHGSPWSLSPRGMNRV